MQGLVVRTNPNPSAANVVELLLETGKTQKLSGQDIRRSKIFDES